MSDASKKGDFQQWRVEAKPFQALWNSTSADDFDAGSTQQATTQPNSSKDADIAAEQQATLEQQTNEAYQRGFDEGQQVMAEANSELMAMSEKLNESIIGLKPVLSDQLCEAIICTVSTLLERTASFAVPDAELLQQRCNALATLAHRELNEAKLHVHPEDRALIGDAPTGLPLVDDPDLIRGTLRIAHEDGYIEQGTRPVLDELAAMLDELELTR
ncbi:FliH/SctL family protein [Alterisphingorhabdus coralli]|uniref:FliH/SctL family protein n=1 Tax=Alterisphingorhabdus coralli TaxID=3071408 RepID=A0AA97F7M5_9SPHN|nr:FliH/SctL family protein [Parasphingorhabdus sp. SCSIO 66989]WOE74768.1 FliH/SctL family protein [Parasphingorhabdus sp. SCSIO 66989]